MKVFSVVGIRKSGKTTTITRLIQELTRRGYTVGTVKTVFCPTFSMDDPASNTARHRDAGAKMVAARSRTETDLVIPRPMDANELLAYYHTDFVILEGDYFTPVPRIVAAHSEKEVEERRNSLTFAVSGRLATGKDQVLGLPALDVVDRVEQLADLVEKTVYDLLPNVEGCGKSCPGCVSLGEAILRGEARREDCPFGQEAVHQLAAEKKPLLLPETTAVKGTGVCQCGCHKTEHQQEARRAPVDSGYQVSQLKINNRPATMSPALEAALEQAVAQVLDQFSVADLAPTVSFKAERKGL